MKAQTFTVKFALLLLIAIASSIQLIAQDNQNSGENEQITREVLHADSLFWQAYNTCDLEQMERFLTEDLEFYHDKGGLTKTLSALMESMKNGICNKDEWRVRREPVPGSLTVYPLNNYGAILTGEHMFYETPKGKEERFTGTAKFTHVWHNQNGEWKMSRVLSYDHQPVAQQVAKKQITLPDNILMNYVGKYEGPHTGTVTILKKDQALEIHAGKMREKILPESQNIFFLGQNDLTFEFVRDSKGKVAKMIVREHGEIVEEARRLQ